MAKLKESWAAYLAIDAKAVAEYKKGTPASATAGDALVTTEASKVISELETAGLDLRETAVGRSQAAIAAQEQNATTTLIEIVIKGSYFGINLATDDLDATFELLEGRGADVVQEPIDQDYGVRDAAFRDPAGNLIRIQEKK